MPGPALTDREQAILRSFAGRIDPSDAGAHNNLGVLYYQKGLVPEAIAAFSRALELDPRMQVAQDNLDLAYRQSGHFDARIAELQERLRRNPDDRDARWELGRAYASLGIRINNAGTAPIRHRHHRRRTGRKHRGDVPRPGGTTRVGAGKRGLSPVSHR